jgi:hypothetical protein
MQKIGYLLILCGLILFVYYKYPRKPSKVIKQKIGSENFNLEIADTSYLLAKGLSGRTELCPSCGMLFIFKSESIQTFWMKDTLIPLDIIFIKENGEITDIYTASPEKGKSDFQLTLYKSSQPTKYVIELSANTAKNLNLKTGDLVNINFNNN